MLALTSDGVSTWLKGSPWQFASCRGCDMSTRKPSGECITQLLTALPSLSAARILAPPHPHCVSAGKQRRRGFFVVMPSSGCPTFGLSFSRGDLTMRRASVETVDHRAASAASGRLASSACLAISASIDAISVILIYLLVGSSFVSSGRFKGQHRCPIDTAGS
jgi:hypothetical protein